MDRLWGILAEESDQRKNRFSQESQSQSRIVINKKQYNKSLCWLNLNFPKNVFYLISISDILIIFIDCLIIRWFRWSFTVLHILMELSMQIWCAGTSIIDNLCFFACSLLFTDLRILSIKINEKFIFVLKYSPDCKNNFYSRSFRRIDFSWRIDDLCPLRSCFSRLIPLW